MVEEVSWEDFGTKPIEDDEIAIDKRDFIDEDLFILPLYALGG